MTAGDRAWPQLDFPRPGKQPWLTAEFPAVRDVPEEIPYLPKPRGGRLRAAGKHRRPGLTTAVTACVRRLARPVLAAFRTAAKGGRR